MEQGGLRLTSADYKQPLVSIVCVTFNAARTLPQLINSIAEEKAETIEFIIIDGNSDDNTIDILKQNDHQIDFWLSEPDNGIYDAMNSALKYVKGQWIIFLGADDLLSKDFKNILSLLNDTGTIYYGNATYYGTAFAKVYDDYYLTKLNICHQVIFYPKSVFAKYKYDLRYTVYADYHLNLRCWHDPEFKFVHVNHFIAIFPEGGFSYVTKDTLFERDREMLFKKYLRPTSYYRYLNRTIGFWRMLKSLVQNK